MDYDPPLQKGLDATAVPTKADLCLCCTGTSAAVLRTECAVATGHLKLSPPTSVVNTVCYLHLLVHVEVFPLASCAGLLLWLVLRLLGVLLAALTVHCRGVHYYNPVWDGGRVWRCGVRHLLGLLRFQSGAPKMSHLGETGRLATWEKADEGGREWVREGGRHLARQRVRMRQSTQRNSTGN